MKIFEKIFFLILIFSLVLKTINFPGSSLLILITSMSLSIFYFFLTLGLIYNIKLVNLFSEKSYRNISSFRTIGLIGFGIALSSTISGIMLVVLHWREGLSNLIVGIIALLLIVIVATKKRSGDKVFYNRVLIRTGIWLIIGLIVYFIF